jgi:hypothetical protein
VHEFIHACACGICMHVSITACVCGCGYMHACTCGVGGCVCMHVHVHAHLCACAWCAWCAQHDTMCLQFLQQFLLQSQPLKGLVYKIAVTTKVLLHCGVACQYHLLIHISIQIKHKTAVSSAAMVTTLFLFHSIVL